MIYDVGMEFTKPKALKRGDVVGIFTPSYYVTGEHFRQGLREIESWGLKVKLSKNIFERVADFMAGTRQQRAADFRQMIFDDEVSVIWAAEGGYAATDIRYVIGTKEIDQLKRKPKWFIGYSDAGVLANALMAKGITSVCGPNVWGLTYWKKESREWLRNILFGGEFSFPRGEVLVKGEAEGRLLATNLDSLAINFGTKYDPVLVGDDDLILALEDWKYSLSSVQRQFDAIFDHARFDRVRGIILGRFGLPYEVSYPQWAEKTDLFGLVRDKLLLRRKVPLVTMPFFGHPTHWYYKRGQGKENSLAVPSGIKVRLSASKKAEISCLEKIVV